MHGFSIIVGKGEKGKILQGRWPADKKSSTTSAVPRLALRSLLQPHDVYVFISNGGDLINHITRLIT